MQNNGVMERPRHTLFDHAIRLCVYYCTCVHVTRIEEARRCSKHS